MSTSRPLTSDPLRSFKFNVIIPNVTKAGLEARFGFMSMAGLGMAIEPLTYREGGDNVTTRKMPGQADFNPITLSRGLFATDYDNWLWISQLFTALYGTATGITAPASPNFRTYMYVNILEHPNTTSAALAGGGTSDSVTFPSQTIVKWSALLHSAWIGSLAYSDLDAGGNAVAVEQMTINYEGFETNWAQGNNYIPSQWQSGQGVS